MFRKKKSTFKKNDKSFKMKELYDMNRLIVGNFERYSRKLSKRKGYPVKVTSDEKYIFEIIDENGYLRAKEVTMGISINLNSTEEFDIPYVSNIEPLSGLYDFGSEKKIPRLAFKWLIKDINEKEQEKRKQLQKQKRDVL